jgi:type I restriction enzyme S subunit
MPSLSLNASKKTKHTPAGEIPVDWGCMEIGKLCSLSNGTGFGPKDWTSEGLPIIRIQNLNGSTDFNYFSGTPTDSWIVEPGDLLFAWAGTRGASFGPTIWAGPRGVLNQHIFKVRPNPHTDQSWLYLSLRALTEEIEKKAHGFKSTLLHVGKKDITSRVVPVPPLPEQIRIATILSTWDRAIETLESLIAAKDRRKQALMQHLLTGRKRLPGFETPWSNVVFGDFLTESRLPGSHGAAARKLTVRLYGRGISEKNEARAGSSNTRYYTRRAGQFIYSKLDFLNGAFAIIPSHLDGLESTLDLPAFDIAPTVHPTWILTYLTRPEFYENCVGFAAGGRKARRVNPNQFLSIRLKLPSLPEQTAIASVLISADRELALHRQHLEALRTQKRGLMQKLLTGQVRVAT